MDAVEELKNRYMAKGKAAKSNNRPKPMTPKAGIKKGRYDYGGKIKK